MTDDMRREEAVFEALVVPHLGAVTRFLRACVGDGEDVADLVQETLMLAWRDLPHLRKPARAKQWLLGIARNRGRDFLKRAGRREIATEAGELESHVNRLGPALAPRDDRSAVLDAAMQDLRPRDRELLHSFYLQGRTIAEIAAREGRPVGTVKRQLFGARQHLREALAVPQGGRGAEVSAHKPGSKAQPFPRRRPEIVISPSPAAPFAVDCQELCWWFGRPVVGDRTIWAQYYPPDWRVAYAYDMRARRDASIHGLDCVEIDVDVWEPEGGWTPGEWTMWGQLAEDAVQWLAVAHLTDGRRRLQTYLDDGFDSDWGEPDPRRLSDQGRFVEDGPGVYTQRPRAAGEIGAGMFVVTVGEREFTCLRVLSVDPQPQPGGILMEVYLTKEGRTVLCRRYNERTWGSERGRPPWDEALPDHARLVVDGLTFVHWYDCLTGLALGR
jgi:RNA polymerase sigma factor (sigma-70 family)